MACFGGGPEDTRLRQVRYDAANVV
jgi:hypothetical protein